MRNWVCSLSFWFALAPAVVAAGPTYDVHPTTLAVNTATSIVFSIRLDSLRTFSPGDTVVMSLPNAVSGGIFGVPGPVFVDNVAQPTATFFAFTSGNSIQIGTEGTPVVSTDSVIWVEVPFSAPSTPTVLSVSYTTTGTQGFAGGTAGNDTIAVVDFSFAPQGPTGPPGPAGPAGTSVTAQPEPAGANCPAGGVKIISATTTTFVCNGNTGASAFPKGGILLLAPGSPTPAGFTPLGASIGGFQLWKKN
jgi:hypothetical protein